MPERGGDTRGYGGRFLIGLVFVCVAILALHKIVTYDVWWQLRTGEWILEQGFPRLDPFSYAFPDRPWIEPRWLYCVVLHLVFTKLGLNFLILGKIALLLVVFWVLGRSAPGAPRWIVTFGLVIALAPGHDRFMLRPELASFLGLVATLACLERYKRGGSQRWIYLLPAIQLVWSNTHTLWVLGPVTQWIFLIGELAESKLSRRGDALAGARWRKAAVIAVISTLVPVLNPYLLEGLAFPLLLFREIGAGNYLREGIRELHGPFSSTFFKADYRTAVYLSVIVLSLGGFAANLRRTSVSRLLLWTAFLVVSIKAQRNVALFGFVAAWVTMLNLRDYGAARADSAQVKLLARTATTLALIYCTVMIPLVATDYFYRARRVSERFGFGLSDRRYPIRAMEFIRSEDLPGPLLHSLADGGYVLFEGGPKSAYIDGRNEIYGEQILTDAWRMLTSGRGIDDETGRLGLGSVIVPHERTGLRGALELNPEWRLVYFDHLHLVYSRPGGATVERLAIDWRAPVERTVARPARLAPEDWLAGWWPRFRDGFHDRRVGMLFLGVGNYSEALSRFERVLEVHPGDVRAALYVGLIYRAMGREAEARRLLTGVPPDMLDRTGVDLQAAAIFLWARRPAGAIDSFQRVIEREGIDAGYGWGLFQAAMQAGRADLAERTLREILEADPRSVRGWNMLAGLLMQQGRRPEAIETLRESLEVEPNQPQVRLQLESLVSPPARPTN